MYLLIYLTSYLVLHNPAPLLVHAGTERSEGFHLLQPTQGDILLLLRRFRHLNDLHLATAAAPRHSSSSSESQWAGKADGFPSGIGSDTAAERLMDS